MSLFDRYPPMFSQNMKDSTQEIPYRIVQMERQITVTKRVDVPQKSEQHHLRDHTLGMVKAAAKLYPKEVREIVANTIK
jgi:hypothetical protein